MNSPMNNRAVLIISLVLVDSVHFVFARMLRPHISPMVSVFYITSVSMLPVGVYGIWAREIKFHHLVRHRWFFLSIGALIGFSTIINYEAVAFIDPGTASLLAKTSIVMSIGLGMLWLKERFSRLQGFGAAIALVGALVITFQPADYIRLGSLAVLVSAFMYALHTAIVKRYGQEMDFVEFFFFRILSTSVLMFFTALAWDALVWPGRTACLLILMTAVVDVVISRALFYLVLRRMQMSVHSIVLTLSPVAAVLWTFFLFGIAPTGQQIWGGCSVIIGVLSVTLIQHTKRAQKKRKNKNEENHRAGRCRRNGHGDNHRPGKN
jgi:drug/metabolite transporter (DMT)-like permease